MGKVTIIGITGSIGMGKSTASNILREMGIPVHDADASVHGLLSTGGKAVEEVGLAFPGMLKKDDHGVPYIDRPQLGRIIFSDAGQKKKLEDILHPLVRAESDAFVLEKGADNHPIVALDIPLLFETNGENRVHAIICLSAKPETQRKRVMERPGMTEEKFSRILASQMPDAEKRKRSTYVVETDISFADTRRQLEEIIAQIAGKKNT
jgi:dephospho-CoA kinase